MMSKTYTNVDELIADLNKEEGKTMGFYDWLEGVSEEIDEKIDALISEYQNLGLVGLILYLIPTEKAAGLNYLLWQMDWSRSNTAAWLESLQCEENSEMDRMIFKVECATEELKYFDFKRLYNIYKYWWMPSK